MLEFQKRVYVQLGEPGSQAGSEEVYKYIYSYICIQY